MRLRQAILAAGFGAMSVAMGFQAGQVLGGAQSASAAVSCTTDGTLPVKVFATVVSNLQVAEDSIEKTANQKLPARPSAVLSGPLGCTSATDVTTTTAGGGTTTTTGGSGTTTTTAGSGTTTTTAGATTTSTTGATTTTTAALTTTTTSASTTTSATVSGNSATTATTVAVLANTVQNTRLPRTGARVLGLTFIALAILAFGIALRLVAQLAPEHS